MIHPSLFRISLAPLLQPTCDAFTVDRPFPLLNLEAHILQKRRELNGMEIIERIHARL